MFVINLYVLDKQSRSKHTRALRKLNEGVLFHHIRLATRILLRE